MPSLFTQLVEFAQSVSSNDIHPEIITLPYGLSDSKGVVEFNVFEGSGASYIHGTGLIPWMPTSTLSIETVRLDDIIPKEEKVTLIKMDIEGSEYPALLGAEKIIKRFKPRLAICLYHNGADYVRIPKLIKQYVPEYRLCVRHFGTSFADTVLFAY